MKLTDVAPFVFRLILKSTALGGLRVRRKLTGPLLLKVLDGARTSDVTSLKLGSTNSTIENLASSPISPLVNSVRTDGSSHWNASATTYHCYIEMDLV